MRFDCASAYADRSRWPSAVLRHGTVAADQFVVKAREPGGSCVLINGEEVYDLGTGDAANLKNHGSHAAAYAGGNDGKAGAAATNGHEPLVVQDVLKCNVLQISAVKLIR